MSNRFFDIHPIAHWYSRLNSIREICQRCPLVMNETLLRDLALYKKHKSKGVAMAARSLINFYQVYYPAMLNRHDRVSRSRVRIHFRRAEYTISMQNLPRMVLFEFLIVLRELNYWSRMSKSDGWKEKSETKKPSGK